MCSQQPQLNSLESRVERLETANRYLKRGVVALLLVVGAALLMAQAPRKRIVEADEFRLKDGSRTTASLTTVQGLPVLNMLDKKGTVRLIAAVSEVGPTLAFRDADGRYRAMLIVTANGPALHLQDAKEQETARLDENEKGSGLTLFQDGKLLAGLITDPNTRVPLFSLNDRGGESQFIATVDDNLPSLEFYDGSKRRVLLSVSKAGPSLILFHSDGHQVGDLVGLSEGHPGVILYDATGKALATMPQ